MNLLILDKKINFGINFYRMYFKNGNFKKNMELYLILASALLGIFTGIITGLLPGIHINLISSLALVYLSVILDVVPISVVVIFIIAMSVTHTFIDFIPSIIFGMPNVDTVLSILPGHKLMLEGRGYEAIFLSALGSLSGVFLTLLLLPVFIFKLEIIYLLMKTFIPYLLLLTIIGLLFTEKNMNDFFWALIIVFLSGSLGLLILNSSLINEPLLVLFSGIFGISTILYSLATSCDVFPKQNFDFDFKWDFSFVKVVFLGGIASAVCSVLPGLGNAQAATISSLFFRDITSRFFIILTSVVNTINFTLSLVTFHLISRARNGSIIAISQLTHEISRSQLYTFLAISMLVGLICFFITLFLGKTILKYVSKISLKKINFSIIIFIFCIIFYFSGFLGMLILFLSSSLGFLTLLLKVRRIHLMNVLLIPVIANFL